MDIVADSHTAHSYNSNASNLLANTFNYYSSYPIHWTRTEFVSFVIKLKRVPKRIDLP
jgi:hypothetical protein